MDDLASTTHAFQQPTRSISTERILENLSLKPVSKGILKFDPKFKSFTNLIKIFRLISRVRLGQRVVVKPSERLNTQGAACFQTGHYRPSVLHKKDKLIEL